jgi:hypothetical protein
MTDRIEEIRARMGDRLLEVMAQVTADCFDFNRKQLDRLLTLVPRWIPVTERLPEEGIAVLVSNGNGESAVARLFDADDLLWITSEWRGREGHYLSPCPTHWMPLPKPPKEGE